MLLQQFRSVHPDPIRREADRLTRAALTRWVCGNLDRASISADALAAFETHRVSDVSDDLGEETFLVRDPAAPDGAYVCGRDWCACDPCREESELCWHSLAACLLIGYRSHYARLHAETKPTPIRKTAILVKRDPLTIRGSQDALQARLAECRLKLVGGAQ